MEVLRDTLACLTDQDILVVIVRFVVSSGPQARRCEPWHPSHGSAAIEGSLGADLRTLPDIAFLNQFLILACFCPCLESKAGARKERLRN